MRSLIFTTLLLAACLYAVQGRSIDEAIKDAFRQENMTSTSLYSPHGPIRVEMDILYSQKEWAQIQAAHADRSKRKAIRPLEKRWDDNTIKYAFEPNIFRKHEIETMRQAMDTWEHYTCLKFRQKLGNDKNYVYIWSRGGCSSFVGQDGGEQAMTMGSGCRTNAVSIHELGHALGLQHEQTRTDRDDWVTVLLENVAPDMRYNYVKYTEDEVNSYGIEYDYSSVMHYGEKAFSENGEITMITKDRSWQKKIGSAYGQSFRDVKIANVMYDCGGHCGDKTCPGEGFLNRDCECMCPGAPLQNCETGEDFANPNCLNHHAACYTWANMGECDANPAYMNVDCPLACGICRGDHGRECEDYHEMCEEWESWGECVNNPYYMGPNCAKSCNICDNPPFDCVDKHDMCPDWESWGECENNAFWMKMNCPKSCGVCS